MNAIEPDHGIEPIPTSSDRAFGWVMAAVALGTALWPWVVGEGFVRLWGLYLALVLLLLALLAPRLLAPFNRLWSRFGQLLNKIVTPVVMGLLFFGVVTPIALMMRLFGRSPLQLTWEKDAPSYWVDREKPGPEPDTMKYPF